MSGDGGREGGSREGVVRAEPGTRLGLPNWPHAEPAGVPLPVDVPQHTDLFKLPLQLAGALAPRRSRLPHAQSQRGGEDDATPPAPHRPPPSPPTVLQSHRSAESATGNRVRVVQVVFKLTHVL